MRDERGKRIAYQDDDRINLLSIAVFKPIRLNDLREELKPLIGKLIELETSCFQDVGEFANQQTYMPADRELPRFWIPEEELVFFKKGRRGYEVYCIDL